LPFIKQDKLGGRRYAKEDQMRAMKKLVKRGESYIESCKKLNQTLKRAGCDSFGLGSLSETEEAQYTNESKSKSKRKDTREKN
jgi:hypothetical protein